MWLWSKRNPLNKCPSAPGGGKITGHFDQGGGLFVHPDFQHLMDEEQREWGQRMRRLKGKGAPTAGLGFASVVQPNTEPVVFPGAVALAAATETNLYTPATTTNAAWALLPIGTFRAPQSFRVYASGTVQTSTSALTCSWTSRIGTSATPATNKSLGSTGSGALPSTLTTLWWYEGHMTITAVGTAGGALGASQVAFGNAAAGSITTSTTMLAGITAAVAFDSTLQQGYVISVLGGVTTTVTVQLNQFTLIAWD